MFTSFLLVSCWRFLFSTLCHFFYFLFLPFISHFLLILTSFLDSFQTFSFIVLFLFLFLRIYLSFSFIFPLFFASLSACFQFIRFIEQSFEFFLYFSYSSSPPSYKQFHLHSPLFHSFTIIVIATSFFSTFFQTFLYIFHHHFDKISEAIARQLASVLDRVIDLQWKTFSYFAFLFCLFFLFPRLLLVFLIALWFVWFLSSLSKTLLDNFSFLQKCSTAQQLSINNRNPNLKPNQCSMSAIFHTHTHIH